MAREGSPVHQSHHGWQYVLSTNADSCGIDVAALSARARRQGHGTGRKVYPEPVSFLCAASLSRVSGAIARSQPWARWELTGAMPRIKHGSSAWIDGSPNRRDLAADMSTDSLNATG